MDKVLEDIRLERKRQDDKWGADRIHEFPVWLTILMEEVGEVSEEALNYIFTPSGILRNNTLDRARNELIQIAAVTVAIIEAIDDGRV